MYFGLGLLAAGLLVLVVAPVVWRRAVRLLRTRIEAGVPMSRSEIEADKDRMRADFAIATRRLEQNIGHLSEKFAGQAVEVGRKQDQITALTAAKEEMTATIFGLDERVASLNASISEGEAALAAARSEIDVRDGQLAERARKLASTEADLDASRQATAELRLELVARNTQIGNLDDRIATLTASEADLIAERERLTAEHAAERDRLTSELAAEREALAAERQRVQGLEAGLGALQVERTERLAEIERRGDELKMLEAEIAALRVQHEATLAELSDERQKMAAERERAEGLVAQVTTLTDERSRQDEEAGRKDGELQSLAAEIAREREHGEAERNRAEGFAANLTSLQAEHTRQQDEAARISDALQALSAEIETERDRTTARAAETATAAAERDRLAAELAKRQEELTALNAELFEHVRQEEAMEKRLHDAEMAFSDTKAELVSLRIKHQTDSMVGSGSMRRATEELEAEKKRVAERLAALERDHAALLAENTELRRVAGPEWESDRRESQQLRERLNEIATNVVRLTQTIASGDADAPRAAESNGNGNGHGPARQSPLATPTTAGEPVSANDGQTLAERLRALQHAGVRH